MKLIEDMAWQLHYRESFENEQYIRKYEQQANDLIDRIPLHRPVHTYVTYKRDLTERLNKEMEKYSLTERHQLLKTADKNI